jgi:hypothetical protein
VAQLDRFEYPGTHRLISSKFIAVSALESLPLPPGVLADATTCGTTRQTITRVRALNTAG